MILVDCGCADVRVMSADCGCADVLPILVDCGCDVVMLMRTLVYSIDRRPA
jgi:hypothetical protein